MVARDQDGLPPACAFDGADRASVLVGAERGVPVRLSASAYRLLFAVRSGVSFETLAATSSSRRPVSPQQVETAYLDLCRRFEAARAVPRRTLDGPGFWGRRQLLGDDAVAWLAGALAPLFRPALALPGMLVAAAALVAAFAALPAWHGEGLVPAYGLFLLSLLAHELGHAAACVRFGIRPAGIGVVFYLAIPACYADVTRAWRLGRWQRVAVDLGGVYVQSLVAALYLALFAVTGVPALRTAALLIAAGCLIASLPVLRFDGYWALADALGVPALDRAAWRELRRSLRALGGSSGDDRAPRARRWRRTLVVYGAVSVAVWTFLAANLGTALAVRGAALPSHLSAVAAPLAAGSVPPAAPLVAVALFALTGFAASVTLRGALVGARARKRATRGGYRASRPTSGGRASKAWIAEERRDCRAISGTGSTAAGWHDSRRELEKHPEPRHEAGDMGRRLGSGPARSD